MVDRQQDGSEGAVGYRTALILSAAYVVAPVLLAFVGAMTVLGDRSAPPTPMPVLIVFVAVSVLGVAASFVLRPLLMRPRPGVAPQGSPEQRVLRAVVVGWALVEAGVLLGFVYLVLSGSLAVYAGFLAIYAVGAAGAFATPGRWERWISAASGETGSIITPG